VLAFRQSYTGGTAPDLPGERIETTSCAVGAEGHSNAEVVGEVATTFSSFRFSELSQSI
jgi:hypothetical protein